MLKKPDQGIIRAFRKDEVHGRKTNELFALISSINEVRVILLHEPLFTGNK